MSTSKLVTIMLLLGCSILGSAQQHYDLDHFTGLKSEGPIPADLRKSLDELNAEDKARVREYTGGRLTNRDRVMEASYYINRLTSNGRILYGDPITRMVERIADTLLKEYPELRKELRFYTVKSPAVNAFATGQGMIFVNTGLVSSVLSEDELAFIISHEIIHYFRDHNTEILTRKKRNSDNLEVQLNEFLKYHNRSHEMEMEADSLGMTMFYMNSPYNQQAYKDVYNALSRASQPWGHFRFDTNYFNTPFYSLSTKYILKLIAPFEADETADDSKSTHPNIAKRRQAAESMMKNRNWGKAFVTIAPEDFNHIRNLAKLENIRQELIYADYVRAFWDSYEYLISHPDNSFCIQSKAQALYGIAKYRSLSNSTQIVDDYQDHRGEIQQCYYMFAKVPADELTILAIREMWKAHLDNPDNTFATNAIKDLFATLRDIHKYPANTFSATYDTTQVSDNSKADPNDKYTRFRQKKHTSTDLHPLRFAFTDLMADNSFTHLMQEVLSDLPSRQLTKLKVFYSKELQNMIKEKGVFLYAPTYVVVENNDNYDVKYQKSDRLESDLPNMVSDAAKTAGLTIVDFSDPAMRNHNDATFYNDFVTLNEWTNELWQSRGRVPMCMSLQPQMDDLNERYHADKLSLNTTFNLEYYKTITPFNLLISVPSVLLYPGYLNNVIGSRQHTITRNILVDTRIGAILTNSDEEFLQTDSKSLITNEIYSAFNIMLHTGKPTGFLGNRFAVTGEMGLHYSLLNKATNFNPYMKAQLSYGFGLEYVTKEKRSLHLDLDHRASTFFIENGYANPSSRYYDGSIYDATLTTLALSHRWYTTPHAPHGTYCGLGISGEKISILPQAESVQYNQLDTNFYRAGIRLEFGRNYIFAKRILFNWAIRYNFSICNPIEYENFDDIWNEQIEETRNINFKRHLNANIWHEQLLVFHLSLGFLPF